jgi:hypothetical protein
MSIEEKREKPRTAELARIWVPVLVLAVLCVWGYVDLKTEIHKLHGHKGVASPADPLPTADPAGGRVREPAAPEKGAVAPLDRPGATVDWNCQGVIAQDRVLEVVGTHGQAVFDCYLEVLARKPGIGGTLALEINVGSTGEVQEARVRGPLKDPELLACVSDSVYGWDFPPPEEGPCAIVSVPFMLDPKEHRPTPPAP